MSDAKLSPEDCRRMINTKTGLIDCPDCGTELLEGPAGGCCVNMKCPKCDVVFNCGFGLGTIVWADVVNGIRKKAVHV